MPFPCTICIRNKKACAVTIAVVIVYLLNQIDENNEYAATSKIINRGYCWKRDGCSDGIDFLIRSGKGRYDAPVICVNGTVYVSEETKNFKRGLNLVVFQLVRHRKSRQLRNSSDTNNLHLVFRAVRNFDTFESDGELLRFLKYSVDESFILLGASHDEMSARLGEDARHIMEQCGLRNVSHLEHRDAYAFVAQPGLLTGVAIESLSKRVVKTKRDAPTYAERATVGGCLRFPMGALRAFRIDRPVVYVAPPNNGPISMHPDVNESLIEALVNETRAEPEHRATPIKNEIGFIDEQDQIEPFEFKTVANAVWYIEQLRLGERLPACGAARTCPEGSITIGVHSGVENQRLPSVCVDERIVLSENLNNAGRGFNLVVLHDDGTRWRVNRVARFDTYSSDSTELEIFLERVQDEELLIALASDESSRKLSERARSLLADFGAAQIQNLHFRDVYLLIGQRGNPQEREKVSRVVRSSERNDSNVTHIATDFVALEELELAGRGSSWPKPIDRVVCLPERGRLARFHVRPEPSLNKYEEHRAFCERYAVRTRTGREPHADEALSTAFEADSAFDRFANREYSFPIHADYAFDDWETASSTQQPDVFTSSFEYPYADFCDSERFAEPLVPLPQLDYALQLSTQSSSVPKATVVSSGVAFSTELYRVPIVLVVDTRRPEVARLTLDSLFAQPGLLPDVVHVYYASRSMAADEQLLRLLQLYRIHVHPIDSTQLTSNVVRENGHDRNEDAKPDPVIALQALVLESVWKTFAAEANSAIFVHEGVLLSPDCLRMFAHLYDAFLHDTSVGLVHAWNLHGLKRFSHNVKLIYRVRQYLGLVYLARRSWASWWTATEFYRQHVHSRSVFDAFGALTQLDATFELKFDSYLPESSRAYYIPNAHIDISNKGNTKSAGPSDNEMDGQSVLDYFYTNEPHLHVSRELLVANTQQFSSGELLFENETSSLSSADAYFSSLQTALLDSNTDVIFLGKLKTSQSRGENNLAELVAKMARKNDTKSRPQRTVAVFVNFASQLSALFTTLCRGAATRLCYLSRATLFADSVVRFSLSSHLHFLLIDTTSALCDSYVTLSKSAFVCG